MTVASGSASATSMSALPVLIPAGSEFVRIHGINHGPIWFGPAAGTPPSYRFDAENGGFGVLYGAQQLEGAFVETLLRRGRRILSRAYVEERKWSVLQFQRDVRLLKLYDEGLAWHNVTSDICTGDDYKIPQAFSTLIHQQYPDVDGIAYRARHDNGQICYALFDRIAAASLLTVEGRNFADEKSVTESLMRRYNASWDPLMPIPAAP